MSSADVRILVVDDEMEVRNFVRLALERRGFHVDTADCASAAIEAVRSTSYHLLLVDLALPDDSGIELIRNLSGAHEPPAVIVLTGHPSMNTVTEAMQLRTRNYLTKPISPGALVEAVEEVLTGEGVLISSEEQLLAELGRRLRGARQASDLTMKALGERIGISQAQISQIEAGLSAPSLATLFRLTRAVNMKLSKVFEGL